MKAPQGKSCPAIIGKIEEGQEVIEEYKGSPPSTPASLPRLSRSSITRFSIRHPRTWAEELGLDKAVQLLETTLNEEKETDKALTELAEIVVNAEAEAGVETA